MGGDEQQKGGEHLISEIPPPPQCRKWDRAETPSGQGCGVADALIHCWVNLYGHFETLPRAL